MTEPARPTAAEVEIELTEHIELLAGAGARPRPEQIAAVTAVVAGRQRTLLVARTGFGKSAVYFSATKMLRARGWGPTIVISPLLALMRDQVAAARRLGLQAETINSANLDAWGTIEERINNDEVDLLLIAPERLANPGFRERVFDTLRARPMALVCDEAHCISDWGHDFRPDYRRLRALLAELPSWTPVLATTATANQRVTDDVASQLGQDTLKLRTSLDRESLHLSVVDLPTDGQRLAWASEHLDQLDGSGIIYCLTVDQAEITADWLRGQGHEVAAYTGAVDAEARLDLEQRLRNNELKALTATSALGMGFDKGDLAFCVHLGLPPSPVAYYQQIGRAGRNLDTAEVIALPRPAEDAAVWRWFESVSLPSAEVCNAVLDQLDSSRATSIATLETVINLGRTRLGTLLNILEVDRAIERVKGGWVRTQHPWTYDQALADGLRALRRAESDQMLAWSTLETCRLRFLREALDDPEADDCGRCDNCLGTNRWQVEPAIETARLADQRLRGDDVTIEPRKMWPTGVGDRKGKISPDHQMRQGRALARVGDGGWGPAVANLINAADRADLVSVDDDMIAALASVLKGWDWDERPTWICPMPSRRRDQIIDQVASGLGALGKLPVHRALIDATDSGSPADFVFQSEQANSAHQVQNVLGRIVVDPGVAGAVEAGDVGPGPVLLIDDEADSRWTLTVAADALARAGLGPVLPLVLRLR